MRLSSDKTFVALGKILDADFDSEDFLDCLVKEVVQIIHPADAGIIYLYDKNRRQLIAEASYGYTKGNVKCNLVLKEGAPGRCFALRKPLLFSSVKAVMEQVKTLRPASLTCETEMRQGLPPTLSMIAMPLTRQDQVLGVILLEHYQSQHRAFSEAKLSQLGVLSGWISLIIDYVQSHLELKRSKRSYRELLGRFIARSEGERKQIAREIHDEVNQLLLTIKLNLEDMEKAIPANMANLQERLKIIRSHINQVFDDLHKLSLRLRPPALDELGLPQALDWYTQNLSKEACLLITLNVKGLSQRRSAPVVETELFRITQEALSNVIKHAQASSATINLRFNKSGVVLVVEDDGKGFDMSTTLGTSDSTRNLGLLGMMERAEICGGTLEIDSVPKSGTRLRVEIPRSSYDWGAY